MRCGLWMLSAVHIDAFNVMLSLTGHLQLAAEFRCASRRRTSSMRAPRSGRAALQRAPMRRAAPLALLMLLARLSPCCHVQLAAEFQVRFEAPHVINARTQVWAGSIAAGPDAQSLVATFEQSRKPAFQDSLGRSIAAIAGVVPDGLLVFFSSYSMMDRLKERWEVNIHTHVLAFLLYYAPF